MSVRTATRVDYNRMFQPLRKRNARRARMHRWSIEFVALIALVSIIARFNLM